MADELGLRLTSPPRLWRRSCHGSIIKFSEAAILAPVVTQNLFVCTRSILATLVAILAVLISPRALSDVQDCESVSHGIAEPVAFSVVTKDGGAVRVQAILRKPAGDRKFPAVVVVHGSGGIRPPRCYSRAMETFTRWGYVTLLIDSPSQSDKSGARHYDYSFEDQAYHVRGAAVFLASLPHVDSNRIGVVGWSKGGAAVLVAVSASEFSAIGGKEPFQAAAAIYPMCLGKLENLRTPLLVLIGEDDTQVLASTCIDMRVTRMDDVEYHLEVYPGVRHVFDAPWSSNYDEAAAMDAENRQRRFFARYLQN